QPNLDLTPTFTNSNTKDNIYCLFAKARSSNPRDMTLPIELPSPLAPITSASLDREEMCIDKKRRVSQSEEPTKVRRVEEASLVDVEMPAGGIDASDFYPMSACLSQAVSPSLNSQPQELSDIERAIHTLKIQQLEYYNQPVYIAPMAKSNLRASEDELFPLVDKVKEFLAGDSLVMLILGDSGAGKSTFNRYLENELWKNYKTGGCIPLFINLPNLKKPEKKLVEKQLKEHNFSKDQIRDMKQHRQFILICDGYDESLLTSNLHTTNRFNRPGQWDVKLVITCRSQYLGRDYSWQFAPKMKDRYHRTSDILFQEAVIAPFSKDQIEDYVGQYVPLESRAWVKKDYMDKLVAIPSLMELVKNPILLLLCLETLPSIVQDKTDLSRLRVTRVQLYDEFVRHWLEFNKRRIEDQRLDKETQLAFNNLLEVGFAKYGVKFQVNLAAAIFREQGELPIVDYIHMKDMASWKAEFFKSDPYNDLLREASVLCRAGTQYRFLHRSMLEYFFSLHVWGPVNHADEFAPQGPSNPSDLLSPISDHPLSQRSLVCEHSIIQFLAERVQLDLNFKKQLSNIIELSKTDESAAKAAANAITILVKAGVRFNGENFQDIRIPGANVSGGQFDSAQLQNADLTGVNLTRSWIRQANFSGAMMKGVQFGELPYLKELKDHQIMGIFVTLLFTYSPDGKAFAVGSNDGLIRIFETTTWEKTHIYQAHSKSVADLKYSPCSNKLLSVGRDNTLHLRDCRMNQTEYFVKDLPDEISAVAFSPCGNHFALVCVNGMVLQYSTQTGIRDYIWRCPEDKHYHISYFKDGQHIILGGSTGTIRHLNVNSGEIEQVVECTADDLRCVAISPDGLWIALASGMRLQLLETATGKQGPSWSTSSEIKVAIFSPDGHSIATVCCDVNNTLWSVQTGAFLFDFPGDAFTNASMAFSPDSSQLASKNLGGTIRVWDITSGGAGLGLQQATVGVYKVVYLPDGQSILSSHCNDTLRLYNDDTGESRQVLQGTLHDRSSFALSRDGLQIVTYEDKSTVRVWDTKTEECILKLTDQWIETVEFSPHGDYIATAGPRVIIELLDARSGAKYCRLEDHNRKGGDLSSEQFQVLTQKIRDEQEKEGTLKLSIPLHLELWNALGEYSTHDNILSIAFSSDGNGIVSSGQDGTVRIWNVETREWRMLSSNDHIEITQVEFSPGDTHVAFILEKTLKLWRPEEEKPQHTLRHLEYIQSFAFSSCGDWIVVAAERSIHVWRKRGLDETVANWESVSTIGDFLSAIYGIAWRPDTMEFVTGCQDGSLRKWKVEEDTFGNVSVKLVWSEGLNILAITGAIFDNVTGLSAIDRRLLLQRGAKKDPAAPSDDVLSKGEEEN
ncbi:WD_REPEATS_REGION domain-containing protein, partial [Linnemannia zychae]